VNDFTRVNAPRVEKMVAMLDTIEKSARSNGVDPTILLGPLTDRLSAPVTMPPGVMPPGVTPSEGTVIIRPQTAGRSHWSDVIELARTAPLSDAVTAMTIIVTRIEQELWESLQ